METTNAVKLAAILVSYKKKIGGDMTAEGFRNAMGNGGSARSFGFIDYDYKGVSIRPEGEPETKYTWSKFIKFCRENSLMEDGAAQCVTGQNASGQCGAAVYCSEPYECCAQCHEDCNSRCELAAVKEESTPCDPKPARNAAAAATTDEPAAAAAQLETSTISISAEAAAASTPGSWTEPTQPSPSGPCSPADCGTAAPLACAPDAPATPAAGFDYTGLDRPTVDALHWAEREICEARRDYVAKLAQAVYIAHDALLPIANCEGQALKHNQHAEKTFVQWCASVGLGKDTAYRLLQVAGLLNGATPEEQAVLEAASPSLLYAAAKPSAPAQLVQGVKDGDITTHKQYQELLAQLKAKEQELADEKAAHEAESRACSEVLADEQQRRQAANEARIAAEKTAQEAKESCRTARKALDAARDQLRTQTARVKELEDRPIEVRGADPDDIARWRSEGAKPVQDKLDQAQAEAAALRERVRELEATQTEGKSAEVSVSRQITDTVESILRAQFEALDTLPYETFEAAVEPFEALRDKLSEALEFGTWPSGKEST